MAADASEDTPESTSTAQAEPDAPLLGFLVIGAILYFTIVWRSLPSDSSRWVVTAAIAAVVTVVWVLAVKLPTVRKGLSSQGAKLAGDFAVFFILVGAVLLASIYLTAEDQVLVLKLFAVLYFSLLPAVLYVQFSSRRTRTVWKEYVLNLFQLHMDDYAHLPEPPELTRYVEPWRRARRAALKTATGRERLEEIDQRNIYRRKFEDLFGPLQTPHGRHGKEPAVVSLRAAHKLQVGAATLLIAIGWVFVAEPETVFHKSITPADFELAGLPALPRETIAFAFLGAYFYILQMIVRRFFQNDLKATAYVSATMRIIIVALLVWTIDPLIQDVATQAERSALAFTIGVFPTVGWQALQLLVKRPLGIIVPTLRSEHPLSKLDGLNIWYESRLLEEGIEDMQNLATADLVDVMLNTRIPVERLVDWVDQSLLYLHTNQEDRTTLRRYGVRTATDLLDAFACEATSADGTTFREQFEWVLDAPAGKPSVTRSILATLGSERNLQHIVAWKSFKPDTDAREDALFEAVALPNGRHKQRLRATPVRS